MGAPDLKPQQRLLVRGNARKVQGCIRVSYSVDCGCCGRTHLLMHYRRGGRRPPGGGAADRARAAGWHYANVDIAPDTGGDTQKRWVCPDCYNGAGALRCTANTLSHLVEPAPSPFD